MGDDTIRRSLESGEAPGYPVCSTCGSADVRRDAWATWNQDSQDWELGAVFDHAHCEACDGETRLAWQAFTRTHVIRHLNDALRTGRSSEGMVVVTSGIQAKGPDFVEAALMKVRTFSEFNSDNDPHDEHDFGSVEVEGVKVFFKVDYFDLAMAAHSPDPADPRVTLRVLTVMLAREY